jgi:TusA-related sulfurtransferase
VAGGKYMTREAVIRKDGARDQLLIPLIMEFLGTWVKRPRHSEIEKSNVLVMLPGYGQRRVSYSLNFLGETCLRIYLVTKKILSYAEVDEIIEVVTDNLASIETIQFMAHAYDFLHLATVHDEDAWRLYLCRKNSGEKDKDPENVRMKR